MPFCTQCGHENAEGSRFCSQCGTPLHAGERPAEQTTTISVTSSDADAADAEIKPQDQAAVDALPPACALLIVQRGPSAGSRFLLDRDVVTAGRHPDSDIFLDDVTVSRRHAEFRRTPGGYTVRDVGSLNGSYVNRNRIDEANLSGGDEVQIGKFRLVYFASQRGFDRGNAAAEGGSDSPAPPAAESPNSPGTPA